MERQIIHTGEKRQHAGPVGQFCREGTITFEKRLPPETEMP